jgi:energy-coupling factor transport system substrate-specific component
VRELLKMWGNTRMVVLAAVTAALYAALLIPFKPLVLIPGLTEMRPAAAIPLVAGRRVGPAGAVGAALGNLLGDFFGTLGWGSLFGLGGNFLLAYIPYRLVRASEREYLASWRGLVLIEATVILAAAACGLFIGWGGDLLGIAPFAALGNVIVANDIIYPAILGPLLLKALDRRVRALGLLYPDVLDAKPRRPRTFALGLILIIIASVGGMVAGNYISLGVEGQGLFASGFGPDFHPGTVGAGVAPFIALLVLGVILI